MKCAEKLSSGTKRQLYLAILSALVFSTSIRSEAAVLTDANSSLTINPASDQLATAWSIDGQIQMALQGFYFRAGGVGGEASLSSLAILNQAQVSPNTLNVTYGNGLFTIETSYSLVGGAAGSGVASLSEQIKITNLGGTALDFHFFQYTDFDLGGTAAGDTVQLGQNLQGMFNEALQTKGPLAVSDTVVTPGASHGEIGSFASTLNNLNDGNPTTLNDNAGPASNGDATWAFQWDKLIAAGSSFIIGIDKNVYVVPIPEPSALAILPLGFALFAIVRRHRRM